jgi:hypothetical protein
MLATRPSRPASSLAASSRRPPATLPSRRARRRPDLGCPKLASGLSRQRRPWGTRLSLDPRKRRTTGMKKGMEESYVEDLASHDGPAHALAFREGAAKRWCRGARRPAIAASKWARLGCRRAVDQRKATPVAAFSRAVIGPRGVGEPVHARDLFMLRTGRSHGHPPVVMERRVVRGRLRP